MNELNNKEKIFAYPEEIKERFIDTKGLDFRDGTHVSSAEIWNFMTLEAPGRFPHAFSMSRYHNSQLSKDVEFFSGIKRGYLSLTLRDRLLKAHNEGTPIIHVQGGQTVDPYFAAGGIPIVPGPLRGWARDMQEGLSLREAGNRVMKILEGGRKAVSIDACNNPIAAIEAIHQEIVPVDLIAPYLCLRCSDIGYAIESYRSGKHKVPVYLLDYPISQDKDWTVKYLAARIHGLIKKIGEIKGSEASDEDLKKEIKLENKGRRLSRETVELSWSASIPPMNSVETSSTITLGRFDRGDSLAATQVLEEANHEVRERVKHSVKADGVADDPVRIFSCGSCFGLRGDFLEDKGGIHVGTDDHLSKIYADVDETGDPYENLARSVLSYHYEQPTEIRARWVVELVKQSRADGVICGTNWGCSFQSGISRMIADIVKEETGVPTINLEVAELGQLESVEQTQNRIESFIEMLS